MFKPIGLMLLAASSSVFAQTEEDKELEKLTIKGRAINLMGNAISSSEGLVGQQELALRPILRTGEILETVPGMVVTQHSGTGKANQYFLRGFNLDHGTDFATYVDNMPVNMRSHGHGQGYTDLNFVIPETLSKLVYQKGAYYPNVGDFNGAGSAALFTANSFSTGLAELTLGQDNYQRLVVLNDHKFASNNLLWAIERNTYQGPWQDINEDLDKTNGLVKFSTPMLDGQLSATVMLYDNSWNSADQIPARAVEQGIISDLGSLDKTLGGESSRNSVSVTWSNDDININTYVIDYGLNLWSNFTYFADNNDLGDQFEQVDDRVIYGGNADYQFDKTWFGFTVNNLVGIDFRADDIKEVALYQTQNRQRHGSVRSDAVDQYSAGAFWQNTWFWNDAWRSVFAVRYDYINFEVSDLIGVNSNAVDLSQNNGNNDDSKLSLKSSLIYSINDNWEWYASVGQGLHSNDARGTTIKVDPTDGSSIDAVDPLVRSFGYETGIRGFVAEKLNTSFTLWSLELDSELLFVGDAGNTEATRPSKRQGIEITTYYSFYPGLTFDLEYAFTDAEFTDASADGQLIPGAIEQVVQAGLSYQLDSGLFGSLRARHFGERPLIEDGSEYSSAATIWNLRLGMPFGNWQFKADILNLFNSDAHDIDYFYGSQLAGEAEPVDDIHFHIMEPRTVRLSASYRF